MVPVTAVAVVAGVGTLGPVVADATPNLPDITAQELLTKVQTAKVDGLSGTVRSSADLGLPALPGVEGADQLSDLLSGEHTARVAFASPDKARVSILDNMAERVLTTDGKTAWAYDSAEREAVKLTLPPRTSRPAKPELRPESYDPAAVAKQFLDKIDPSTTVEVSGTEEVAGRDAYKLRLVPKSGRSTVGSVTLAIDAKNWVPLEVTVMPRSGNDPAVQLGFSSVSFDVPAASTFAFTPPKGVKVKEEKVPATRQAPTPVKPPKAISPEHTTPSGDKPTVIGEGWETVVALRDVNLPRTGPVGQLLANARTVEGSWGKGKILTSKMVNALVTDDGRVLVGLVSPDTLVAAAAKAPR
ncbi:outer membrane lipoprotein carrier protein LolA [Kribbella swartbergensis]